MRVFLRVALPILLIAAAVHVAAVWAIPRLVMYRVLETVAARGGPNMVFHAPPATAASRAIPLPSPDLLYSTCALDLADGPVSVSVIPGQDYLSLAVFDAATDNVFVTNDAAVHGAPIRLLIVGPATPTVEAPAGTVVVRLDTRRGLLLLRGLAATPELRARNDAVRRTLVCRAVGGGEAVRLR